MAGSNRWSASPTQHRRGPDERTALSSRPPDTGPAGVRPRLIPGIACQTKNRGWVSQMGKSPQNPYATGIRRFPRRGKLVGNPRNLLSDDAAFVEVSDLAVAIAQLAQHRFVVLAQVRRDAGPGRRLGELPGRAVHFQLLAVLG